MPSRMPVPARRIETKTSFLPSMTLPVVFSSGVSICDLVHRHVTQHLVGHQRRNLVQQLTKAVGGGVLSTHQGELVLHKGMIDEMNGAHGVPLEDRAVADDRQRWQPTAQPLGQRPARRPGAALQHARQRHPLARPPRGRRAPAGRVRRAAPPSTRAIRRSARRPPSRCARSTPGRAGAAHRCPAAGRRCGTRAGRSARRGSPHAPRPIRTARAASRSATATACGTASNRRSGRARGTASWRQQSPSRFGADHVVRQPDTRQRGQ